MSGAIHRYAAVKSHQDFWDTPIASAPAAAPERSKAQTAPRVAVYVIDGDTISLNDGKPNVRLICFNAPETGSRARCEIEHQKGEAARQRLRELVSNGRPDFQQVACSCPAGTEGTKACNFGRRCGTLRVNGVDVGSTLVGEGLAVRFAAQRAALNFRDRGVNALTAVG